MTAAFVDTNVFVYAADLGAGTRHLRAVELFQKLDDSQVFLSAQVLSEYASVVTHPAKLGLPTDVVMKSVRVLELLYTVLPVSGDTVVSALEACDRWRLSYYDAQLWASAANAGVPVILSEDFSDGAELGGVRFIDPFSDLFDIREFVRS